VIFQKLEIKLTLQADTTPGPEHVDKMLCVMSQALFDAGCRGALYCENTGQLLPIKDIQLEVELERLKAYLKEEFR